MKNKITIESLNEFIDALRYIEAVVSYAELVEDAVPITFPGVTDEAQALLNRPAGRDVAQSWTRTFEDTLMLVRNFGQEIATGKASEQEVVKVTETLVKCIYSLTDRLDRLAVARG